MKEMKPEPVVMAVGAHPDDIELMAAGTLLLCKEAGAQIHAWSFSDGRYGSVDMGAEETARLRVEEARASAALAGAVFHHPITEDQSIYYEPSLIKKAASVLRSVRPGILLLPAPDDYMEDHVNTSRILVTAAFLRAASGYETEPPADPWSGDIVVYHVMPFGLRDQLGKMVAAEGYADITGVADLKGRMLRCHASQESWLDVTQGTVSQTELMLEMCREVGAMSGKFDLAEGWRAHSHIGFSARPIDSLAEMLREKFHVDAVYRDGLNLT